MKMFLSFVIILSATNVFAVETLFNYSFDCIANRTQRDEAKPFSISVERFKSGRKVYHKISTKNALGIDSSLFDPMLTGSTEFVNREGIILSKVFDDNNMSLGEVLLHNEIFNGGLRSYENPNEFYTLISLVSENEKSLLYTCTRAE